MQERRMSHDVAKGKDAEDFCLPRMSSCVPEVNMA